MKQFLHKLFSTAIALLVLFSTVSFTVEKHFCGDVLVDVSVFSEANKCKMEALEFNQETIQKKTCCKDKIDVVEGQDELIVKSFDDLNVDQQLVLASYTFTYLNLFEGLSQCVVPHKYYSPPNLIIDKQVFDQVFLI